MTAPACARPTAALLGPAPAVPPWVLEEDIDPGVDRVVGEIIDVYLRALPLEQKVAKMRATWLKETESFARIDDRRGLAAVDSRAQALFEEAIKQEGAAIAADKGREPAIKLADLDALEFYTQSLDFLSDRVRSSIRIDLTQTRSRITVAQGAP